MDTTFGVKQPPLATLALYVTLDEVCPARNVTVMLVETARDMVGAFVAISTKRVTATSKLVLMPYTMPVMSYA